MVKDDYHVIVYKILAYLYSCLKKGENPEKEYLLCDGACSTLEDFPFVVLDENSEAKLMAYKGKEKRVIETDDQWIANYKGD